MTTYPGREKFLKLVADNGWTPDPYSWVSVGWGTSENNPFAFTRLAEDGGTWRILLDYTPLGYNYSIDGRLRGVTVEYISAGTMPEESSNGNLVRKGKGVGTLRRPGKYTNFNPLWETLEGDTVVNKAKKIVVNPDLAVWLTAEAQYLHDEQVRQANEDARRQQEQEEQPLPITVGEGDHGWRSPWHNLARNLSSAIGKVTDANGSSDLPQLIADAQLALNKVIEVLTPEVREALEAHLYGKVEL